MDLKNIISRFDSIVENPISFLSQNEVTATNIKTLLKTIYDLSQKQSNALPKLIVNNFDVEQIWQQIEVQNAEFLCYFNQYITTHANREYSLFFKDKSNEEQIHYSETGGNLSNDPDTVEELAANSKSLGSSSDNESNSSSDSNNEVRNFQSNSIDSDENSSESNENEDYKSKTTTTCEASDGFFNLEDMEKFLDTEDKKAMLDVHAEHEMVSDDSDNELNLKEIDFFAEMSDDNNDESFMKNPMYKDFFVKTDQLSDKPSKPAKRNKYLAELDLDVELSTGQKMNQICDNNSSIEQSNFDQTQERLKKKISTFENVAVSAKGWQMQGEITADSRPENSLLENVLEFDMSTRPAPVITEQTTLRLEDIIRQRIQDRVWDSVQRKEKPVENVVEYKKQLVMDGEKSKLSLAQIYENEYLRGKENDNGASDDKEQEETPAHKEIREMMTSVMSKLDALSNYHFTPKFASPEVKIVTNLSAVSMEEVAPLAISVATLLAPEEVVQRRNKGLAPVGASEKTDTDKNRQRRMKKRRQQRHAARSLNVMGKRNDITQNNYATQKMMKETNVEKMTDLVSKTVKSSTAFFEQLQDQVKSTIKGKLAEKKEINKTNLQAKRFKL